MAAEQLETPPRSSGPAGPLTAPDVLLEHCIAHADRLERAALDLAVREGPLATIPARCAAFRRACRQIASNRGLDRLTVAVLGPRNSGKSTLVSLLVRNTEVRSRIPIGNAAGQSTRQILWIGPQRPPDLDDATEAWIPCPAEELEDVGAPFQLADVPGFNDRSPEVRAAAGNALSAALLKILVVDERDLEARAITSYLRDADGTAVLPVINRAGDTGPADVNAFVAELGAALPSSRILEPLVVPDFRRRESDPDQILAAARASLVERLRNLAAEATDLADFSTPQLQSRLARFRTEIARLAARALPATAPVIASLDEAERRLPSEVLAQSLGPDRALHAVLRQHVRSVWLDNTPAVFFPWRITLAGANLVWGALDRIPLLLLGSVPSLIGATWAAARNVRSAADFRERTTAGLREYVARRATEQLAPLVRSLQDSVAADLGRNTLRTGDHPAEPSAPSSGETLVEGIQTLQERSAVALDAVVERRAPGAAFSILVALLGFLIFWAVAGWPLYAVYLDYFRAALGTAHHLNGSVGLYPTPGFSLVLTTALLGLLPMGVWLVATAAWVTRRGRIRRAARELKLAHDTIIRELFEAGLLRARLAHRDLAACRILLGAAGEDAVPAAPSQTRSS